MEGDRALAHLALEISGELLMLRLAHFPPELAVEFRARGTQARAALVHSSRHIDAEIRIVDRQHPADLLAAPVALDPRAGDHAERGEDDLGHAVVQAAVG